jgi:general secretion pathway protein I
VSTRSHSRGFTLLELLVVLAIGAMLVTLSEPLYSRVVPGARVRSQARDLIVALRDSANKAVSSGRETQVQFEPERKSYVVGGSQPVRLSQDIQLSVQPSIDLRRRGHGSVLSRRQQHGRDDIAGIRDPRLPHWRRLAHWAGRVAGEQPVKRGRRQQCGYTLLEVLVAFAILGMSLAVLFRIFSAGVNNVGVASDYAQAVVIGEARLESLASEPALEPGISQGVALGKFHWTRTISQEFLPELNMPEQSTIASYRINVAVAWPTGRNTRQIELETLRVADTRNRAGMRR